MLESLQKIWFEEVFFRGKTTPYTTLKPKTNATQKQPSITYQKLNKPRLQQPREQENKSHYCCNMPRASGLLQQNSLCVKKNINQHIPMTKLQVHQTLFPAFRF